MSAAFVRIMHTYGSVMHNGDWNNPCPDCGLPKTRNALRCRTCNGKVRTFRVMIVPCPRCGEDKGVYADHCLKCSRALKHKGGVKDQCACGEVKEKRARRCKRCDGMSRRSQTGKRFYVRIQVDGKSVLEHRVVMERMLGQTLKAHENVHHINGVITDNRPENLELWIVKQPRGQRIPDLVAWAKEILEQYGEAA